MSRLQGESTLSPDEKVTEAKRHVAALASHLSEMRDKDRDFVQSVTDNLQRYGVKTVISNAVLFWLRDLAMKY
jgi:hypothetical protein